MISTLTPLTWAVLSKTRSETAILRLLKGRFGFHPIRKYVTRAAAEPFLNGSSSVYVEEMFNAWTKDPSSVHKSWDVFFRGASSGLPPGEAYHPPPSALLSPSISSALAPRTQLQPMPPITAMPASFPSAQAAPRDIDDHLSVQAIIRSYQVLSISCSLFFLFFLS